MKSTRSLAAILSLLMLFVTGLSRAENTAVYSLQIDRPVDAVYDKVYKSLEDARFYVVFEPNIGVNLSRFEKKWGDEYNQNELTAIRSMVFCNGWYANRVSNLDPQMLGFCPLHITLIESENRTTVLFNRPTAVSGGSPANTLFEQIESEVIEAIETAVR